MINANANAYIADLLARGCEKIYEFHDVYKSTSFYKGYFYDPKVENFIIVWSVKHEYNPNETFEITYISLSVFEKMIDFYNKIKENN